MPDLVLASTSRYRRQLLERLGVPFCAEAPRCDEEALKHPRFAPQALAEHLALAKAESLREVHPQAVIIGSDQVAEVDGVILGKPGDRRRAVEQLARLAGRTHRLITAMAVLHDGRTWRHCDLTRLTMRPLGRAQLERYVERDDPVDCAGAYKLEAAGIGLFSAIESADHTAIVGLPLIALTAILAEIGFAIP